MSGDFKPKVIAMSPADMETIDQHLKAAQQVSILYEGALNRIVDLKLENDKQQTIISIMAQYMCESLGAFEMMFESDEAIFPAERMQDYITASRYMHERYGRKNIADRVEEKMKALPF